MRCTVAAWYTSSSRGVLNTSATSSRLQAGPGAALCDTAWPQGGARGRATGACAPAAARGALQAETPTFPAEPAQPGCRLTFHAIVKRAMPSITQGSRPIGPDSTQLLQPPPRAGRLRGRVDRCGLHMAKPRAAAQLPGGLHEGRTCSTGQLPAGWEGAQQHARSQGHRARGPVGKQVPAPSLRSRCVRATQSPAVHDETSASQTSPSHPQQTDRDHRPHPCPHPGTQTPWELGACMPLHASLH